MNGRCLKIVIILVTLAMAMRQSGGTQYLHYNLTANYDKRDSPGEIEEAAVKPFVVKLKIRILDIISIKEFENLVAMDMLIIRMWKESRLILPNKNRLHKHRIYPVNPEETDKFWVPDFYVLQMRSFTTNQGNMELRYLLVMADQSVLQIQRVNLILKCKFSFELYPLDIQECEMDFMTPLDPAEDLVLKWWEERKPVAQFKTMGADGILVLPEYRASLSVCSDNFIKEHVSGNVSTVRLWLVLDRQLQSHLLETYVPTALFVAMSWGSFLVKPEIVPGRMVLLVTNLLSLVTLFESTRSSAPPAVGIKVIDIWLLSCICFVFLALLEYAIILFTTRSTKTSPQGKPPQKSEDRVKNLKLFTAVNSANFIRVNDVQQALRRRSLPHRRRKWTVKGIVGRILRPFMALREEGSSGWCRLDQISLVFFPLMFLLYNIVYWTAVFSSRNNILSDSKCPSD